MTLNSSTKKAKENSKLTLIFVHGNSQSSAIWQHQLRATELQQFILVTIELPGHGQSPRMENYTVKNIVQILADQINKEQDYILIGHSLGGHFCIEALPKLNNCLGLMLCGTPPLKKPLNLNEAFNQDERMALLFQEDIATEEHEILATFMSCSEDLTVIKDAIKQSDGKFRKDMGLAVGMGELLDEVGILKKTKLPIAFIRGALDGLVNQCYLENIALDIDGKKRFYNIENAGHSPHFENPVAFNKIVLEFGKNLQQI